MEARWRMSSFSEGVNNCVELAWRKAAASEGVSNCVELARGEAEFRVRDSKNPAGPVLSLTPRQGVTLLNAIKHDRW